jgi:DNA-binding response OmpR family regulator
MNKTIMVVDDESRIRRLISDYLKKEGFIIIEAENGEEALAKFKYNKIDLIILDLMMPRIDGLTVCKNIRLDSDVPILMLTAKSEEYDELLGFDLGADDYVKKPFSPKVLVAKSKALLKRSEPYKKGDELLFTVDDFSLNEISHCATLAGEELSLSPKEYELLLYFVKNEGIALTRDKILDNVWGMDYYGDSRTVDTNVKRLREKLKHKGELINTIRGSGYKFEVTK